MPMPVLWLAPSCPPSTVVAPGYQLLLPPAFLLQRLDLRIISGHLGAARPQPMHLVKPHIALGQCAVDLG